MNHRFRLLSLFCAALLLFTACSPSLSSTETVAESTTETQENVVQPVAKPGTKAALAALPVATAEMTEAERRQLCVDFARLQTSFQWTPSHNFIVEFTQGTNEFRAGKVYGGVPYAHPSSSLYAMLDLYDDETGIVDTSRFTRPGDFNVLYGNDCADSVFWAWARVSSGIKYTLTRNMVPLNGCLKLGDYEYDETMPNFDTVSTHKICEINGQQAMFRAYALLQPADGMVTCTSGTGHARMAATAAHVEYDDDGRINGTKSYVTTLEQVSSFTKTNMDGQSVQVQGGVDKQYTFSALFSSGYIPLQIPEVAGISPVQTATATLEGETTAAGLPGAAVVTNYRIAKVFFSVTNAAGEVVLDRSTYGTESSMYRLELVKILGGNAAFNRLDPGDYQVKIEALVGSGQTLTAYEGPLTVE